MRPKKARPDARGVLLKEQPFTFRQRKDGSVAIFWNRRPATVLTGKLAENFLAVSSDCSGQPVESFFYEFIRGLDLQWPAGFVTARSSRPDGGLDPCSNAVYWQP